MARDDLVRNASRNQSSLQNDRGYDDRRCYYCLCCSIGAQREFLKVVVEYTENDMENQKDSS